MPARTIVIIGYDGCTALDLTAAAETFHTAAYLRDPQPYRAITASVGGASFSTGSGLRVHPDCGLDAIAAIDTLILPGGAGLRDPRVGAPIVDWIRTNEPRIRRIASVCTGLFGLAATGLLDGRRAATHWRFADQLQALHPKIRLDADAIFVRDGKYTSSAGVTAGIDLALALIEEDLGPAAALAVAREMVVYMKRPGGQRQFSDQLRFQTAAFRGSARWSISFTAISTRILASSGWRRRRIYRPGISPACSANRSECRRASSSNARG